MVSAPDGTVFGTEMDITGFFGTVAGFVDSFSSMLNFIAANGAVSDLSKSARQNGEYDDIPGSPLA
ncbi:hypothetical protein Vi05172_g13403 [Venturia inaequalis]|nr:hypothetical protein Vi05172_g13403 [Venturia inaequalis]